MNTPKPTKPISDILRAPKEALAFTAKQEPWAIYELEDGSMVRIRIMLVKAIEHRGPDGKMAFGPNGEPMIEFKMQQIMDVDWSPEITAQIEARKAGSAD